MLKAGLTGGVGAGKSRILSWMEKTWGAGIIRTDEVAHQLLAPGEKAYNRVTEELGTSVMDQEGRIDRPALARLIFQDGQAKKTIDRITHPLVWESVKQTLLSAEETKKYEVMVVESALFDEASLTFLDEIWYVYTPKEIRIERLMESRGYSREKCRSILANQRTDEEFRRHSHRVIVNDGNWVKTEREASAVYQAALAERNAGVF